MNIEDIVHEAGMSARPGYYAGRGAIACDLNSDNLEGIYKGIKREHGEAAAEAFVDLVESIPKLSATAFLNELYSFAGAGFKFNAVAGHGDFDFDKDDKGEYNVAQGMAAMFGGISGQVERDETVFIRGQFLYAHGRRNKAPDLYATEHGTIWR